MYECNSVTPLICPSNGCGNRFCGRGREGGVGATDSMGALTPWGSGQYWGGEDGRAGAGVPPQSLGGSSRPVPSFPVRWNVPAQGGSLLVSGVRGVGGFGHLLLLAHISQSALGVVSCLFAGLMALAGAAGVDHAPTAARASVCATGVGGFGLGRDELSQQSNGTRWWGIGGRTRRVDPV